MLLFFADVQERGQQSLQFFVTQYLQMHLRVLAHHARTRKPCVWGSGGIGMPFIILRLEGNHWPEMITFAAFVIHIKCCANIIFWSKLQGEVPCMF